MNLEPRPASDSKDNEAPISSRIWRQTNSPKPVPCDFVVKNGWKSRLWRRFGNAASLVLDRQQHPPLLGFRLQVNPAPRVSGIDRIQDQVENDLSQVIAHGTYREEINRQIGRDRPLFGALIILGDPGAASSTTSAGRTRTSAVDAGLEKSTSSRIVRWIRPSCLRRQAQLLGGIRVGPASLKHLNQGAECGQRVAHFVGDPGGQESERSHLLVLNLPGLRRSQRVGSLGDSAFEIRPVVLQLAVQMFESRTGPLQERGERSCSPRSPRP